MCVRARHRGRWCRWRDTRACCLGSIQAHQALRGWTGDVLWISGSFGSLDLSNWNPIWALPAVWWDSTTTAPNDLILFLTIPWRLLPPPTDAIVLLGTESNPLSIQRKCQYAVQYAVRQISIVFGFRRIEGTSSDFQSFLRCDTVPSCSSGAVESHKPAQ